MVKCTRVNPELTLLYQELGKIGEKVSFYNDRIEDYKPVLESLILDTSCFKEDKYSFSYDKMKHLTFEIELAEEIISAQKTRIKEIGNRVAVLTKEGTDMTGGSTDIVNVP
jgi:hypothetical protein